MSESEKNQETAVRVGDYVRWEHGRNGDNWAEGVVLAIHDAGLTLDVRVNSPYRNEYRNEFGITSARQSLGYNNETGSTIRRVVPWEVCADCGAGGRGTLADHRKVCERRPVEVGDYVRLTIPATDGSSQWVDGELKSIRGDLGRGSGNILVGAASERRRAYVGQERPFAWGDGNTIRHVPRPEQAKGDPPAGQGSTESLAEYIARVVPDAAGPVTVSGPGVQRVTVSEVEYLSVTKADGLTGVQCLELYEHLQRGEFAPTYLSTAQLDLARRMWSATLRAGVKADAERERNVVRVDLEVESWE